MGHVLPSHDSRFRWALLASPLLAALYVVFTLVGSDVIEPGLGRRPPPPPGADHDVELPATYLDRVAVRRQRARQPDLIRNLLHPAFGAPLRLDGSGRMRLVFANKPQDVRVLLLSREAVPELDEHLYALPPLPGGAELHAGRMERARERLVQAASARSPLPFAEREALATIHADEVFAGAQRKLIDRVAQDNGRQARRGIDRVQAVLAQRVRSQVGPYLTAEPVGECAPLGVGDTCAGDWQLEQPAPPGLYVVLVVGAGDVLVDWQLNAAYRPRASSAFSFAVGADPQWGDKPSVAAAIAGWISMLNAVAAGEDAPEFVLLLGDVVDCAFGSAGSIRSQLLGGAKDYSRDYIQAWLAFAALRLPIYFIPGNHDGYRFEDAIGATSSDGLLLFESTLGPTYQFFDRPPLRIILANSYDLPPKARTIRRSKSSELLESLSDKLNVMNWGGSIGEAQHRWLRRRLGLDGESLEGLLPLLMIHHDPRGAYPSLRAEVGATWDLQRHVPLTVTAAKAWTLSAMAAPRSDETEEIHAGYYSPLRYPESEVRAAQWFDFRGKPSLPASNGYPGWSRYQQEWHLDTTMVDAFGDLQDPTPAQGKLVSPERLLTTLVEGRVRAIFKGHDNRFARAELQAGESILGAAAEASLTALSPQAPPSSSLRLEAPLSVYHIADVGDAETDGHGYGWVEVAPDGSLTVLELDHAAGAILPPHFASERETP